MNIILFLGAVLGLSSIGVAAYIDHSVALHLSGKPLSELLTAVRYHQLYAIVVSMIGLTLPLQFNQRIKSWLTGSAYIFSLGSLLFSFSIYFSVIFSIPGIISCVPIGGMTLIMGWAFLLRVALLKIK
ncbi:MAG: DUF423 domain-containing protein [Gammaproteobacteria bacterium]|nr:MAG: DUF423 domain-containing protein [Gammaproteobacteria bacterium]